MQTGTAALSFALLSGALLACSNESGADSQPVKVEPDAGGELDAGTDAEPVSACAAPLPSTCKKDGSWVRGIARFDPSHFAGGKAPILRVVLRHSFALLKGEETVGGRLHGWKNVPVSDASKGEIPFALDMCDLGTSMWSEENGTFHLVLMLDENGNNDLETASTNTAALKASTPDPGELVKMVDVDLSCNAPSPCLEVTLDCATGTACTTITPVTSCKKVTPGCNSDSAFCK